MTISAILLNPGNRLLHGGTVDFATFGAQPVAVSVDPAAVEKGPFVFASGGAAIPPPPTVNPEPTEVSSALYRPSDVDDRFAAPLPSAFPLSAPAGAAGSFQSQPAGASDPGSFGGNQGTPLSPTIAPSATNGADQAAAATGASAGDQTAAVQPGLYASAFHAPVLDSIAPSIASEVFGLTGGLSAGVLTPTALIGAMVNGVVTTTLHLAEGSIDTIGQVGAGALTATSDGVEAVAQTATAVLDDVGTSLNTLTDDTAATTTALADTVPQVAGVAEGVTAAVSPAVTLTASVADTALGQAQDSVTATVMPLVDHLAGGDAALPEAVSETLGGTDPAAGIATLTAMVESSDVFEIAGATTGGTIDTAASALDAVPADAVAVTPLLGDDHGSDGLLHHDDGDGSIGIGGL